MSDTATFLDTLFDTTDEGYVTISVAPVGGQWRDDYAVAAVADLAGLSDRIGNSKPNADVYATVCPRLTAKRGNRGNTASVTVLWIELDSPESSDGKRSNPDRYFTDIDDAHQFISDSAPWRPALIIDSGHGWHVYWKLTEPVIEGWDELLAAWHGFWEAKATAAGKSIDSVFDSARVMRVPGTWNVKGVDPVRVSVVEYDANARYDASEILDVIPVDDRRTASTYASSLADDSEVQAWLAARSNGTSEQGRRFVTELVDEMRTAPDRHPTAQTILGRLIQKHRPGVNLLDAIDDIRIVFGERVAGERRPPDEFDQLVAWTVSQRLAEPSLVLPVTPEPADIESINGLPITAYRSSDLDVLADIPVEFVIRGFLAGDTAGMWGGAQKTLKTELQIGLDMSVVSGVPFLGHPEFKVRKQGPVLVFVGEGGLAPYMRRVRRVAAAYGITNPDDYVITGHLGDMSDPAFIQQVADTVEAVDPVLVRIDPYYAYHGGDTEAGNLFAQGKLLTRFQTAVAGRTFLLTHHFNEGGRGLDLARFTQAGSAQWIDSWVQVVHRETPNPDEGLFWLGLKVGSRQWGERLYEVDVNLGTFDMDGGHHDGVPTWEVRQVDYSAIEEWGRGVRKTAKDRRPEIAKILRDEPWTYTRTDIVKAVGGHEEDTREHLDALIGSRQLLRADVPFVDAAGRNRTRAVLGFSPETVEVFGIGIPISYPEPPKETL